MHRRRRIGWGQGICHSILIHVGDEHFSTRFMYLYVNEQEKNITQKIL
jgi:hypothetical protein